MMKPNYILIGAAVIFCFLLIQILAQTGFSLLIDFDKARVFALSLSGILSFLSIWLLYITITNQVNSFKLTQFENKFFELLKLHQHNVSDIEINNKFQGRKAFVKMYDEIRFIYAFLLEQLDYWNLQKSPKIEENPKILMELAYTIFFFGVDEFRQGFKTNFIFRHEIHTPFAIQFAHDLQKLRNKRKQDQNYKLEANSLKMPNVKWSPSYKPFGGHVSKLGHCYRHLYQLVKFVAANTSLGLSFEEKYEYIKTVRAQLSNHEQALIYFNSFFNAGEIWWEEKHHDPQKVLKNDQGHILSYFLDYRIIKNIPFNLTRFGPNPEKEFSDRLNERGLNEKQIEEEKKDLFEWIGG